MMRGEFIRRLRLDNDGRKEYFWLRKKWSWVLVVALSLTILYHFLFCWMLGAGVWKYDAYKTFPYLQTVEFFGQIVGLCWIVVTFLFSDPNSPHSKKYLKGNGTEKVSGYAKENLQ